MNCEICNRTKPIGLLIQDIKICNDCLDKLTIKGELDYRDFTDAVRIWKWIKERLNVQIVDLCYIIGQLLIYVLYVIHMML